LDADTRPKIILSASGMATGGRVLHHLRTLAPNPRNTVVFTGFQAGGTRGRDMVEGAKTVRIYGEEVDVRCEVVDIACLSAHADREDIVRWLAHIQPKPRAVMLTHGEPTGSESLRRLIRDRLAIDARVPQHLERIALD